MDKYLKIGEMAELNHVSTQTLRLYAKNQLLEPEYQDPNTGYRYYTLGQCVKLDLIHALKSCDMPLSEIRDLFAVTSVEKLADLLAVQSDLLKDEIFRLSVSRSNLLRLVKNLRLLKSLPPLGLPYFEYIDERLIDVQKTPFNFFEEGYAGYEKMLRHMQNYMFENHLPPSYFVNIGTIIEKENFIHQTYESDLAFVFADTMYPEQNTIRRLPPGLYLCVVLDNVEQELAYAQRLRQQIENMHMQVNGDYICEVLSQFPFTDAGDMYFKIQVPVIRRE